MVKANFIHNDFLLTSSAAKQLFHEFAKDLPIIDYHNHLPPEQVAKNHTFSTISEVWLKGDHYKWRAMRANGINESYITGDKSDEKKFLKWAETVPYTMRNPLYHWTHLELKRYFDIDVLLKPSTASQVYCQTNELLQEPVFQVKGLLQKMNVEVICTTDHPTDLLSYHKQELDSSSDLKMLPTFRPDKFLAINSPDFLIYLEKLEEIVSTDISSFSDLVAALKNRIDYFDSMGCQLSDHGLAQLYNINLSNRNFDAMILSRRENKSLSIDDSNAFQMALLFELAEVYFEKDWKMQLHLGAIRNNSDRLLKSVGNDVGADSIGDFEQAQGLSFFLNQLDSKNRLTKTIIYNLNPRDNEVFATMIGNFNDGNIAGKIQWGSAWWFLDQKDGMVKQINTLSNMGLLSRFIGMLTDSRSFLSFPRHEYFRRILCNLIGNDIEKGELPNDIPWLGHLVENICYKNAKDYFNF